MEGKDAGLHWEWQDELLADLDSESPWAATPHSLWEDITQSEVDMEGLFETTPASKIKVACTSEFMLEIEAEPKPSVELMSGDSPRLKRRRMLQFEAEEEGLYASYPSMESEPFDPSENYSNPRFAHREELQMQEPTSTSSMWYMVDERSLSSLDDPVERSDDSWMAGCFREREAEAPPVENCMARYIEEREAQGLQNKMSVDSPSSTENTGYGEFGEGETNNAVVLPKPAYLSGRSVAVKLATPVAYPFEVVKPSGMQGDVTLNDINRRIMMRRGGPGATRIGGGGDDARTAEACRRGGAGAVAAANSLRKSVVALTKIHTQGNGTITIMRTKN